MEGQGSGSPLKNRKTLGFFSNIGADPLKNNKAKKSSNEKLVRYSTFDIRYSNGEVSSIFDIRYSIFKWGS